MVNYDLPWNPARLEQRLGRIHRYGQQHNPVIMMNMVAGSTREGRVMHTLLEKLEAIRRQLGSDKVFDVIGHLFEGESLTDYMRDALTASGTDYAVQQISGKLTAAATPTGRPTRGRPGAGAARARTAGGGGDNLGGSRDGYSFG